MYKLINQGLRNKFIMSVFCFLITANTSMAAYDLNWYLIGGSSGSESSVSYAIQGTGGQPIFGSSNSMNYGLGSGYWYGIKISSSGIKGDLNSNGISADAGDLVLMKRASIGEIVSDSRYDLNNNGQNADAGDLVLMKRASIGEIMLS